jgi:hypothetical protein
LAGRSQISITWSKGHVPLKKKRSPGKTGDVFDISRKKKKKKKKDGEIRSFRNFFYFCGVTIYLPAGLDWAGVGEWVVQPQSMS